MIIDVIYPRGFIVISLPHGLLRRVERLGHNFRLLICLFAIWICMLSHVCTFAESVSVFFLSFSPFLFLSFASSSSFSSFSLASPSYLSIPSFPFLIVPLSSFFRFLPFLLLSSSLSSFCLPFLFLLPFFPLLLSSANLSVLFPLGCYSKPSHLRIRHCSGK